MCVMFIHSIYEESTSIICFNWLNHVAADGHLKLFLSEEGRVAPEGSENVLPHIDTCL